MSAILAFENPGRPVLRGIEHFWTVIRELDEAGPWSIHDIDQRSNVSHRSTIADFVRRLVAAGIAVEQAEQRRAASGTRPGPKQAKHYRLQGQPPLRAPRLRRDGTQAAQGRGQQQMWNVMRSPLARDGFTFHDLVLWGSTETIAVSTATAKKYVQHLAGAGYLNLLRQGGPRQPALWRLQPAMNTGPRPPLILTARIVYDQNRMTAAPFIAEEEKS